MKTYNKDKEITPKTTIVSVDIGKSLHYGYLRCFSSETKPFSFSNNMEGFNKLWSKVEEFKIENNLEDIIFGFESTGSYGEPLKFYMQNKGAKLIQVNPMHTKRLKEISDNSPNKTDEKDPRVIADILMLGYGLSSVIPEGKIAELRELVSARESKMEDINRVKNRMEALLARYFPEFLEIMALRSKTSIYLLKKYSTSEAMAAIKLSKFTKEISKVSRGQIKYAKAESLHKAAENTVGIKQAENSYKSVIHMQLEELTLFENQLIEIEEQIKLIVDQLPESRILSSVRGISHITIAYLVSEVVNFKAYKVEGEIIKFAGLNLYEVSSGKHKGKRQLSKRGRTLLRKALYMASLNMIRKGGIYHKDYQGYLSRGIKKTAAIVIVMKRLLRLVFALVRKNETFNENYPKGMDSHNLAA